MPKFHFNVYDGRSSIDDDGTEFTDREHARAAAVGYAGALIEDEAHKLKPGLDWRLDVADDAGSVLYQLRFTVAAAFPDRQ